MDLYKELLCNALEKEQVQIIFPQLKIDAEKIIQMQCYQMLCKIRDIICDEKLDDAECYMKIEKVILLFEELGDQCGDRHDFC